MNNWTQFILESPSHPTRILIWVIVVLVALFVLSRTHNILEEKSVNQAIRISRGLISSILVFIVGPIILFIILNGMALIHDLPFIHIQFILDWIWLTISSFWWLIRCLFKSADLIGAKEAYSVDSLIRIVWILIPLGVIWFRIFSSFLSRSLFIPLVVGTFLATLHMNTSATFLTSNGYIPSQWSLLLSEQSDSSINEWSTLQISTLLKYLIVSLLGLITLYVGFVKKNKKWTIVYASLSLVSLLFIFNPKGFFRSPYFYSSEQRTLDSLTSLLTNQRYNQLDKIKIYDISNEIKAMLDANPTLRLQDTLCVNYTNYFYDYCN